MLRYDDILKDKARELRKHSTDSERALWARLRGRQLLGIQFYRQKPIGNYIVDFYAPKAKLIVEVDGSQHLQNDHIERDKSRDTYLAGLGLEVLRFDSREVLKETDCVAAVILKTIEQHLAPKIPPGPPLPTDYDTHLTPWVAKP